MTKKWRTCVPIPLGWILIHPAHQLDPAHSLIWSLHWKNKWYKSKRQLYHWLRLVKPHYNISLLICLSINAKSTYLSLKYVIIATKKPSLKRRDFKHPTKLDTLLILGWAKFYGSELARKLPSDDARTLLHRWAEPYGCHLLSGIPTGGLTEVILVNTIDDL